MAEVMALPLSAVTGITMLPEPSKPVAVPVAAPDRAMVRFAASLVAVAALPVQALAVVAVVAVAALPVVLTEAVPVSFDASSDVTGIAMLAVPSKPVAVPVAAPLRAMVRAVASLVALAALPVSEPVTPRALLN